MANTLQPGDLLGDGRYRVVRLLGQGGMGSVFEAENTRTQKHVAIKCLHPTHQGNSAAAERMAREAQASARVRHPNVVDVYDEYSDDATVFLVMEYLEGEPLSHALARGDLSMSAVIALLLPAMRAVAAAHKQGVIHRDIKPDNIFLAREMDTAAPIPKVLDFGISKLGEELGKSALTRSGVTIGTPSYMSYEQLAGDKTVDGRTDVYAFGVVLYEALTGKLPYEADTLPELIVKLTLHPPSPPKELKSEIPSSLSRIVLWALERDRNARIPSIEALIRELEPFATERGLRAEMTSTAPTQAHVQSAKPLAAAKPARKTTKLVLAGAVLLVAVGAALWSYAKAPVPERASQVAPAPEAQRAATPAAEQVIEPPSQPALVEPTPEPPSAVAPAATQPVEAAPANPAPPPEPKRRHTRPAAPKPESKSVRDRGIY